MSMHFQRAKWSARLCSGIMIVSLWWNTTQVIFVYKPHCFSINCKCGLYRKKPRLNYLQMWCSLVSYGFCYYFTIDKPLRNKKEHCFFLIVNTSFTCVYVKKVGVMNDQTKQISVAKVPKSQMYTFGPHSNILVYEFFNILIQNSPNISRC